MPEPEDDPVTGPGQDPGEDRPRSGRERLLHALLRPHRSQAVVGVLLALVGFGAITQVRSTEADDTFAGYREQDLIDVLNGLAGTTQRAQSEIARLEETRDDLRSDNNARQTAIEQAQTQADTLGILAGLVPVTGPGIRVTIEEVDGPVRVGSMLDMVQELRTVGAEAMQVNGQVRVVAQTSIEQVPGGLLVDGQILGPPYVVDVIGASDVLKGAMVFDDGPVEQLEEDGATVEIDELSSLDIEAVRRAAEPDIAEADPAQ